MQKIIPCLCFNNQAEEAANFYTKAFKEAKILHTTLCGKGEHGAAGTLRTVALQLLGQKFLAVNGGSTFNFTPSVSFVVNCEKEKEIDDLYQHLSEGGSILMPFQKYPFSEKFAWIQDKFGVSWQLNLTGTLSKIIPFFMFVCDQHGKAEEAINFYMSLFENARINNMKHYGKGESEQEGTIQIASFMLAGQEFMAIDSNGPHHFTFANGISFYVNCETQQEIDRLWEKFSAEGTIEECGWLKDKYGVSWQIVPTILYEMMSDPDSERSNRVMQAILKMKKLDIETLKKAYRTTD